MNTHGIWAIYRFEMARALRTIWQSLVTPVITTSLYFVVFGGAIGSRMSQVGGVGYGSFIVPGLIMLSLLTQSIANASFGIYFPRFTGTIYEILSPPLSAFETVLGYVGAAMTKAVTVALVILLTANLFVPVRIDHPVVMIAFLRGAKTEINLNLIMQKRLTLTGSTLRARPVPEKGRIARALAEKVWPLIASGKIKPVIDSTFPMSEAAKAHARMETSAHIGKIVLTITS